MDLNNLRKGGGEHPEKGKDKGPGAPPFLSNILTLFLIFLFLVAAYSFVSGRQEKTEDIALSQLARDVQSSLVKTVGVEGSDLSIEYVDGTKKTSKKEVEASLSETLKNYGVTPEELSTVQIEIKGPSGFGYWALSLAPILLPIMFLLVLVWFLTRQVRSSGGMQAFSFGQSKARVIYPDDTAQKVTFKDIAGVKEAKEELSEIVEFLRQPKKFLDIGAQIPKGVMLMGAPGTGKTLLARAVAGEAGVPFFHLSGSEFVEMFVGVGASRVRDLFRQVKKEAPAIIFVDEIDAVGRVRGTGVGGGNDEREQTLNQILVEMDGFEPNEKIIVMAATNRPDVLDPALLRPGRFDRRVVLELPDLSDREAILNIHARKKPLAEDVNLHTVAERTPGFSGADLYSLMNEGAILAARENRKKVSQFDFIRSIEKVMMGPERRSHILSDDEKRITAYHEGGHALLASLLKYAKPVHKISIISRGHAAGYTLMIPDDETRFRTRKEFLDDITVSLGGYVAEEMVFDDLTTGPSNDLQVATATAHDMVAKYGMSATMGPIAFEQSGSMLMSRGGFVEREYSEDVASRIDKEVSIIMQQSLVSARELLAHHRPLLDAIAEELVSVETIERDEFEKLLILHGVKPKRAAKNPTPPTTDHGPHVKKEPNAENSPVVPEVEKKEEEEEQLGPPPPAVSVSSPLVTVERGQNEHEKEEALSYDKSKSGERRKKKRDGQERA
jgi:cell division protease FtsH